MGQVKSINVNNLKIARQNIGLTTISASKKLSSPNKDIVLDWENGNSLPTWVQATKLGKIYNIPEILFFSDRNIDILRVIPDYRTGVDPKNDEQVKKLINIVVNRQHWLEKKLREEDLPKNTIQGSGKHFTKPNDLAAFIITSLNLDLEKIKSFSGKAARERVLTYLIESAESKGIFVGKTMAHIKIGVTSMRGLFISNDYCPFIILNRKDSLSAQIFSFIHELAHLFRKTDAISNVLDFRNSNVDSEEYFCNRVAAELLLPASEFTRASYDKNDIKEISSTFKVSELFIFYRLKELGKIRTSLETRLEQEIKAEMEINLLEKNMREQNQSGGNYDNNMKDSNGRLFNRVISDFYMNNQIDYVEASKLLRFSVEKYA